MVDRLNSGYNNSNTYGVSYYSSNPIVSYRTPILTMTAYLFFS